MENRMYPVEVSSEVKTICLRSNCVCYAERAMVLVVELFAGADTMDMASG
jgi:hypothetical protein